MRMLRLLSVLVCGLGLFHASAAAAQSLESKDHDGMYFRLHAGPSFLNVSNSDADFSTGGLGYGFALAAGHTISDNLMLFGEFMLDSVSDPETEFGGTKATAKGVTLSSARYGAGVAYYFMPINAYVSGSLLLGSFSTSASGVSDSSDTGFGAKVGVGKEWMLAPKFGLGVAGTASFLSVSEENTTSTGTIFGLALSATYN